MSKAAIARGAASGPPRERFNPSGRFSGLSAVGLVTALLLLLSDGCLGRSLGGDGLGGGDGSSASNR